MGMEYYKFSAGRGFEYVRTTPDSYIAECFDIAERRWVREDAYYTEIYSNGGGQEVTEAEVVKAVGLLQSA